MPRDIAHDRAEFFGSVVEQKEFKNIIDLAFGSGNLTSHIVLDNDLIFDKIYFMIIYGKQVCLYALENHPDTISTVYVAKKDILPQNH